VTVRSVIFEVTQRCNHDCLHCYNVWKNRAPYPMGELGTTGTIALLSRVLDETGASLVTLTGGEPLVRPDLDVLVDFLTGRGVTVNLITNGTLLDEARIARLAGRVSLYEVPLLADSARLHDRLSGAPGAFDRVTMAVADLKAAGQRVVGVFVATALNLPAWTGVVDLAMALGLDGLMFNRFNPGGRGFDNLGILMPDPDALADALDHARDLSARYDLPISCSIPMPPCLFDTRRWPGLGFGACAAGTDRAYYTLDPAGNLRPCNHSPTILGSLLERSFGELTAGAGMARFLEAVPDFCRDCAAVLTCRGCCKAAGEACHGMASALDPFVALHRGKALRSGCGGRKG
jgi:radical SAM protein with 4Fe4S-binding SPASM domain